MKKKVLFASYGGGHAKSLIPLIKSLSESEIEILVFGFTTAKKEYEDAGLTTIPYTYLLRYIDNFYKDIAYEHASHHNHPLISMKESLAYYSVGFHDLVQNFGYKKALQKLRKKGRAAFCPEHTFKKYLEDKKPDVVVTTSSPRSELALQLAAKKLGVKGLVVSDLFLRVEIPYMIKDSYASTITTLCPQSAAYLKEKGNKHSKILAYGNPAFDFTYDPPLKGKDIYLRRMLSIPNDKTILTWISSPPGISLQGKKFIKVEALIDYLEAFCKSNPSYFYLIKPHPNHPINLANSHKLEYGYILSSEHSINSLLSTTQYLITEVSSVAVQAALWQIPVITIDSQQYQPYHEYGISVDITCLEELGPTIIGGVNRNMGNFRKAVPPDSTKKITNLIREMLKS